MQYSYFEESIFSIFFSNCITITTISDTTPCLLGCDVPCNPVMISYAMVTPTSAYLFIDEQKVPQDVKNYLIDNGVEILPYADVLKTLTAGV
jgi:hypothetical protein